MKNNSQILAHLMSIKSCTLLTTGRTGTDFLHSLLDSHPEVLTFNGHFQFYSFWGESKCVKSGNFALSDFVEEFIGKHIEKFKSRYDYIERKDQLGVNYDQTIEISTNEFKVYFLKILEKEQINSKNCLLALYGAYSLCLKQDLNKKVIFFHHLHSHNELDSYLKDFPDSKIISMTRDPRANIVSGVKNHKKYRSETTTGPHQFFFIKRILEDTTVLKKLKNEYISIKIEDLGSEKIITKLTEWLSISNHPTLKISTWGGLIWNGDRVSVNERLGTGFSKNMLNNNWEGILSGKDKYIFNFIMYHRLKKYQYPYKKLNFISYIAVPFFCVFLLSYEKELFSIKYLSKFVRQKKYKIVALNIISYFRRVHLFLRFYLITLKGNSYECNILHDE
jgi:hypothetical protein